MSNTLFSVVKHYKNGSEPMFIQEDLTYEEAKKIVNSFPDSKETMVTFLQQEKKPIHCGTFNGMGTEYELSECTGIGVETLENLKGARIQILSDATGDDEALQGREV